MYYQGEVLFPFGYGLSYTSYAYSNMKINADSLDANETLEIRVDVSNTGRRDGSEIVELYVGKQIPKGTGDKKPVRQLKGFQKVFLKAGETKTVTFSLPICDITFWSNLKKRMVVEPGTYRVEIGKSSAEIVCSKEITVNGVWEAPLTTVYVLSDKYIFRQGETASLKTTATLADTARISLNPENTVYKSSDPTVLEVDACGKILAKGVGTAVITVTVTWKEKEVHRKIALSVKE